MSVYGFFAKLYDMNIKAGILVIVVILLRIVFKKTPKKHICLLWALVAFRLICPFGVVSNLSAYNLLSTVIDEIGQKEYFGYDEQFEKALESYDEELPTSEVSDDNMRTEFVIDENGSGSDTTEFATDFAFRVHIPISIWIWLMGVNAMIIVAGLGFWRVKKEISASLRKKGNVYVCDDIRSPFILGIISPRIYIPSGMSENTLKYVIAHEEAHIARCDHLWKPLGFLLLSIYWFNPCLWVAYILLCSDIETACDERVIEGMNRDEVTGYLEALLSCASHRRLITACPIAFGENNVKNRVKRVMNYKKPAFWMICVMLIVCTAVAVFFLTDPKSNMGEDAIRYNDVNNANSSETGSLKMDDNQRKEDINDNNTPYFQGAKRLYQEYNPSEAGEEAAAYISKLWEGNGHFGAVRRSNEYLLHESYSSPELSNAGYGRVILNSVAGEVTVSWIKTKKGTIISDWRADIFAVIKGMAISDDTPWHTTCFYDEEADEVILTLLNTILTSDDRGAPLLVLTIPAERPTDYKAYCHFVPPALWVSEQLYSDGRIYFNNIGKINEPVFCVDIVSGDIKAERTKKAVITSIADYYDSRGTDAWRTMWYVDTCPEGEIYGSYCKPIEDSGSYNYISSVYVCFDGETPVWSVYLENEAIAPIKATY